MRYRTSSRQKSALIGLLLSVFSIANADEVVPPKYNLIDQLGVNMASGQVQVSQVDLSIGGDMGLTHIVQQPSGAFFGGFNDNFSGRALNTVLFAGGNISPNQIPIIRVSGLSTTVDFRYTASGTTFTSFTALNDPRNTLEFVSGTGLVMTLADGTEYIYETSSFTTSTVVTALDRVRYPNGLQLTFNRFTQSSSPHFGAMSSVRTNTGFQMKYQYVDDNRPLDPVKQQNTTMEPNLPADSLSWSRINPKHIMAVNNSVRHCNVASSFCSLPEAWPTATYQWPAGMPRAMVIDNSTFSVTDAEGRTTHYHHFGIDKAYQLGDGSWLDGILPGTTSIPRITSIDPPEGSPTSYDYENRAIPVTQYAGLGLGYTRWFPNGYAILNKAQRDTWIRTYDLMRQGQNNELRHFSGGYQAVNRVEYNGQLGVIRNVFLTDKTIYREDTFANRIKDIADKRRDMCLDYEYDARLNITAIKEHDGLATNGVCNGSQTVNVTVSSADYPSSCTATNRKFCNKPIWIEDAKGNRTDYTYHGTSGQIASVTSPPNEKNIRAQIRYQYKQVTPTHFGADKSPVWVLDKERFCRNSAYNGSSCSGNDETVITYQYETKNVLRIGKAVTANGVTLRTCYRYDRFARQIGETEPKANLSTCTY